MRQDTNYAYAVARIKAMENKLLKSSDIDTLIDAPAEDLIEMLAGFGYPANETPASNNDANNEIDPLASYTEKLTSFFAETVRAVMKFSPEPEVLACFLIPADYNNLKICIKEIVKGSASQDQAGAELSRNGTVSPEDLWNAVVKKDFSSLDLVISSAAKKALDELAKSGNSRNSDIIIDKACFTAMKESAYKGSLITRSVMNRYLYSYADWKNLLAAMRISKSGANAELLKKAYLPGNISQDYFIKVMNGVCSPFSGTKYEPFISAALGSGQKSQHDGKDILFIERLSENYLYGQLIKDRNEPYRINALLAYIAARKREISAVRLIAVGKRARLTSDEIRKMIEESDQSLRFIERI